MPERARHERANSGLSDDNIVAQDSLRNDDSKGGRVKSWVAVQGMRVNGDSVTLSEGIKVSVMWWLAFVLRLRL